MQLLNGFVEELRNLARNCDFGKTNAVVQLSAQLILEEKLRDRLVCGMADTAIQRRLLVEADLDCNWLSLWSLLLPTQHNHKLLSTRVHRVVRTSTN